MELAPLSIVSKNLKKNSRILQILRDAESKCFSMDTTRAPIDPTGYINVDKKYKDNIYTIFVLIFNETFAIQFDNIVKTAEDKIRAIEEGITIEGKYIDIGSKILGHAVIVYDTFRNIGGIYNVCKHDTAVGVENYGKKMFRSVLGACRTNLPQGCMLWLAVDIINPLIDKVTNIYVSSGFKNPYTSTIDMYDQPIQQNFYLCLTSDNKYIDLDTIDKDSVDIEIKYCIQQAFKLFGGNIGRQIPDNDSIVTNSNYEAFTIGQKDCCSVAVKFDKNYSRYLQNLLIASSNLVKENNEWTLFPAEAAGPLNIVNPQLTEKGQFVWTITDDIEIETLIGMIEYAVSVVDNNLVGSFHTHPTAYFTKNPFGMPVDFGPPSMPDYINYIIRAIKGEMFTGIISKEGIYVFCLTPNYNTQERIKILDVALTKFGIEKFTEYVGADGASPTGSYGSILRMPGSLTGRTLTPNFNTPVAAGKEFARRVELIPALPNNDIFGPIVKCQLITWDDIYNEIPFYISYAQATKIVCTPSKDTRMNLRIIHGSSVKKTGIARFNKKDAEIKNLQQKLQNCNQQLQISKVSKMSI